MILGIFLMVLDRDHRFTPQPNRLSLLCWQKTAIVPVRQATYRLNLVPAFEGFPLSGVVYFGTIILYIINKGGTFA
jgi:hypothetical protein